MNKVGFNSNDMPSVSRFGVGYSAAAAAIAARTGGKAPEYTPRPVSAQQKVAATETTARLFVGCRVKGTDAVPADYKTVNRNFRGIILEIGDYGVNDVRVKVEGTKRVLKVHSRYLLPA